MRGTLFNEVEKKVMGVQGWVVVLGGPWAGVWSGVAPLKRLGYRGKKRPRGLRAKSIAEAISLWHQQKGGFPPRIGVGKDLVEGAEAERLARKFLIPRSTPFGSDRFRAFLVQTDGSYSDKQGAMGFAVVVRTLEGGQPGEEVVRIQGGTWGWGDSGVAEYASIAQALLALPSRSLVEVWTDLADLALAIEGKAFPGGEKQRYLKILQNIAKEKELTLRAKKVPRREVGVPHQIAARGRNGVSKRSPLDSFLSHLRPGARGFALEGMRALPSPSAPFPKGAVEANPVLRAVESLAVKKPELFLEAWKEARELSEEEARKRVDALLLASMEGKPVTQAQKAFLEKRGIPVPKDRAEASVLIARLRRES